MDSYYARQPIFNLKNDTIAYELLFRNSPDSTSYNFNSGDNASVSVINNAFFGGDPRTIFNGKKTYINFTEGLLNKRTALLLPKDVLVIEVLESVPPTNEVFEALKELKEKGYRMALDDYVATEENMDFLKYADIVKIDFRNSKEDIENTARICRMKSKRILAEKIETAEELEYAKSLGAVFFQGYFFAKPVLVSLKNPTPLQTTFLRLVSKINYEDVELREISRIIKTDAAMTLKFLRYVNFLRYDWMEKIKSVHQAVTIAGLKRTRDFVYFVGLQEISKNLIDEMITTGFFRAKFCESMARILKKGNKMIDEMYLMGLISIIVDINSDTSNQAVETLPISAEIKQGILGADSIFGDIFKAVLAYEVADWKNVDRFCQKYNITAENLSKINLICIMHTNELVSGIRF